MNIGPVPVLHGIDLYVPAGTVYGLIGHNGAGKTTLLRALMGLLKPRSGVVSLDGVNITQFKCHRRARLGIGYMPEDRRLVSELSAEENILLPLWAQGIADRENRLAWITELIPELEDFRNRAAIELSGGQQKLVALARALASGSRLLLLDEPTEGIAPAMARRIGHVLETIKGGGRSVLVAASGVESLAAHFDHTLVIERGRIVAPRSME